MRDLQTSAKTHDGQTCNLFKSLRHLRSYALAVAVVVDSQKFCKAHCVPSHLKKPNKFHGLQFLTVTSTPKRISGTSTRRSVDAGIDSLARMVVHPIKPVRSMIWLSFGKRVPFWSSWISKGWACRIHSIFEKLSTLCQCVNRSPWYLHSNVGHGELYHTAKIFSGQSWVQLGQPKPEDYLDTKANVSPVFGTQTDTSISKLDPRCQQRKLNMNLSKRVKMVGQFEM